MKTPFAILSWITDTLSRLSGPEDTLRDLLQYCMNATGASKGFAYLIDSDKGLALCGHLGFSDSETDHLTNFWKYSDIFQKAIQKKEAVIVPSSQVDHQSAADLLKKMDTETILISPMLSSRSCLGVLVLASSDKAMREEWIAFGKVLGTQLGQAIQLSGVVSKLAVSEERYRRIVETAEEGIWQLDTENRIVFANRKLAEMLGYTVEEMKGQLVYGLMDDEWAKLAEENLRKRHKGLFQPNDFKLLRKNCQSLWVLIVTNPVFDKSGQYSGTLGMITDVTERWHTEEQFRHAQKMESIGRLASGVAHDLNNILTILTANSEFVLNRLNVQDPSRPDILQMQTAVNQATALTRQLLTFSRKHPIEFRIVNVNEIIDQTSKMVQRLVGEDIKLVLHLKSSGYIKADPSQIEQVLMNLVVNARDAMQSGGELTLGTSSVNLKVDDRPGFGNLPVGPYTILSVKDTGTGIDEKTRAHLFEPFFTTKEPGKGTGLGLATVYGILQQNGGYIDVTSAPGEGTLFKIFWPQVDGAVASQPIAARPQQKSLEGQETVLIVEDEEAIRTLIRRVLIAKGYTILEARHGKEAIAMLQKQPVHLLITDMVMPEMSGRTLADHLSRTHPDLKILFMSGYSEDIAKDKNLWLSGMTLLQKPFTPDELTSKVRERLDAQG